jgi:outer membrane protein W
MRILLATILSCIISATASGQMLYERYFTLAWDANMPMSNTAFVKSTSFKGFQAGYHQKIRDNFFLGIDFNNATYNDHIPRQTYYTEGSALTTDFFNYVYSYGAVIDGQYFFSMDKKVMPFVGMGVGASYNQYTSYYNLYSSQDKQWGVLLRPEAGAIFKLGKYESWGVIAAAHFDYSSAKSKDFFYSNFMNVGIKVGLVFFDW